MKLSLVLAICVFSEIILAAANVQTTVAYSGSLANGEVYIQLDNEITEPGCTKNRVIFTADNNEASKNAIALALQAQVYRKKLAVKTSGCKNGYPVLSGDLGLQLVEH